MKTVNLIFLLLVFTCECALGQPAADRTRDQAEILKSISQISKAYVDRDPGPFERVYLENHLNVKDSKPYYNHREQLIAMMRADALYIRAGKKLDYDTISYNTEEPHFTFYGDAAVLNIVKNNHWQYCSQKCFTRTQVTEIWIKRDGSWKIAAAHATAFSCASRPVFPQHHATEGIPDRPKTAISNDFEAREQVRAVVNSLFRARISVDQPVEGLVEKITAKEFTATNLRGEITRDRAFLLKLPLPLPPRPVGLRRQDDAILIYDNAAVFTYRTRDSIDASSIGQCSIFLAKIDDRWVIVAAHISA